MPSLKTLSPLIILLTIFLLSGSVTAERFGASDLQEWNNGTFEGTSATINDNSGNLGLGYRNGTSQDSLVGYWRFDRSVAGSGGTVRDYSGYSNDGNTKNGVTSGANGVLSTTAVSLDGSDDYIEVPDSSDLDITGDISWSVWVYDEGQSGGWSGIASKSSYDSFSSGFLLSGDGSDGSSESLQVGYDGNNYGTSFSFNQNEWTHIVVSHDDSSQVDTIYIDGAKYEDVQTESFTSTNNAPLFLGGNTNTLSDVWNGKLDEIRIYDRTLSQNEAEELYFKGKPFHGNYTRQVNLSEQKSWEKLETNSDIPQNTEAEAVFRSLSKDGSIKDEQGLDLQGGTENKTLEVENSEAAEIVLKGNSSALTETWIINSFSVYTGSGDICSFRGPKQECIINETRELEEKTYSIETRFETRENALLESLLGTATLNITNTSTISGLWQGSFFLETRSPAVRPGADFRPENGNIVIGK